VLPGSLISAPPGCPAAVSKQVCDPPTYLLLKERAASFRADPEVRQALASSRVGEIRENTLAPGESYEDLLADRSSYEDFDSDAYFGGKGFGFVRLNQLALEHLLGAR